MKYSPKLKAASEEIRGILKKYDIAGVVVLHTGIDGEGFGEYLLELSPSYSCVKVNNATGEVRVKALRKDFESGEAQLKVLTQTANMLSVLSDLGGRTILSVMELSDIVDKATNAEHGDGEITGHREVNN